MTSVAPPKRTFTTVPIRIDALTPSDLRAESIEAGANGYPWIEQHAYRIVIDGRQAELPQALYLPEWGRLGISWGADATWASVESLEQGIACWLNDPEAWEQSN